MVPLIGRRRDPRIDDGLDALVGRLGKADRPYRAWAAVALLHAGDARHRPLGREIARGMRDAMPDQARDLEHGDIAGYAMLASDALTADERQRVAQAVPVPNQDPAMRARFYTSPLYVYLTARGLATDLRDGARLAEFVAGDALATAARPGTDIPSLVLQLATAFELGRQAPVPTAVLGAVHARLVGDSGDSEAAIAVRWLITRYAASWPVGPEAAELRRCAERFAQAHETTAATHELRLEVAAMRLETTLAPNPEYRLVSDAALRRQVAAGVLVWRGVIALAFATCLATILGLPAWLLGTRYGLPGLAAVSAAASVWLPATLWTTLAVYGRHRRDGALMGAVAVGVVYYIVAAYGAMSGSRDLVDIVAGKDAMIALIPIIVGTVAGALPAARD